MKRSVGAVKSADRILAMCPGSHRRFVLTGPHVTESHLSPALLHESRRLARRHLEPKLTQLLRARIARPGAAGAAGRRFAAAITPSLVSGTPPPSIPCGVSSDLTRPSLSRRCASFASRRVRVGPLAAVRQCVC